MPSAQSALDKRKGDSTPLLKGSNFPMKTQTVKIKIREARIAPADFGSPMILDLAEPVFEKEAMPLNKTNVRQCIDLLGDDYDKWKNKVLLVRKTMTNNPKTRKATWGMFVEEVLKK